MLKDVSPHFFYVGCIGWAGIAIAFLKELIHIIKTIYHYVTNQNTIQKASRQRYSSGTADSWSLLHRHYWSVKGNR